MTNDFATAAKSAAEALTLSTLAVDPGEALELHANTQAVSNRLAETLEEFRPRAIAALQLEERIRGQDSQILLISERILGSMVADPRDGVAKLKNWQADSLRKGLCATTNMTRQQQ